MNKLSDNTIYEIDRFITYCNTNKNNFQKENAFRTDLKKFVENCFDSLYESYKKRVMDAENLTEEAYN